MSVFVHALICGATVWNYLHCTHL